jgi:O-acetyl-ADP-ribose deacetylase (regulator of RNase III)
MRIIAVRGDITEVNVDAVVNPINAGDAKGAKEGKLVRALFDRGGSEVEDEAAVRGPIQVGEAIITTGGNLKCRYVIHAPVGEAEERMRPDGVKRSARAALRCAAGGRLRACGRSPFPR